MTYMTNILASSLGTLSSQVGGLSKLILPRNLPASFRREVALAAKNEGGMALVVGDGVDELSPQQAISYRTPENANIPSVLMVTTEAHAKELKSLETFRSLLAGNLPGGVFDEHVSPIRLPELCEEICKHVAPSSITKQALAAALCQVAVFLGRSYRAFGNEAIDWASGFWRHFDMLVNSITASQASIVPDHPDAAMHVVYLAAGLPRPLSPNGYAKGRDPDLFAKIVVENWSSATTIERAIVDAELVGTQSPHPIGNIDWSTLASSKAYLGHSLLALSRHDHSLDNNEEWLKAWGSFTEDEFFDRPPEDKVEVSVEVRLDDGSFIEAAPLPVSLKEKVFVLRAPDNKLGEDGELRIGDLRVHFLLSNLQDFQAVALEASILPKVAAKATLGASARTTRGFSVDISLSRVFRREGKWPEKPITLLLTPTSIGVSNAINDTLKIQLLLCNPTRPTVLAIEHGKQDKLQCIAQAKLIPDEASHSLTSGRLDEEPSQLSFAGSSSKKTLLCLGEYVSVGWQDGNRLESEQPRDPFTGLGFFQLKHAPDSSILEVDDYLFKVEVPVVEVGKVVPIAAAAAGQEIVPLSGDTLDEVAIDPRYHLECWLRDHAIASAVAGNFRACLGTVVLSSDPNKSTGQIAWDEDISAYADLSMKANAQFPKAVQETPAFNTFWESFLKLGLSSLPSDHIASALPSALDLRSIKQEGIEEYLRAYSMLLKTIDTRKRHEAWAAFPFSAIVFNPKRGEYAGALLSPLHPIRLAWNWGSQMAASELAADDTFSSAAESFLRFVDGDSLPLIGPSLNRPDADLALSLAPGPREFFCAWSMLAPREFHNSFEKRSISVLKSELPLGAPSGLDGGGVSAAVRDYMRVFPFTPQMRIGLSSSSGIDRFAETDEAVVSAVTQLVQNSSADIPGGVRVFDSSSRKGRPPNAAKVLRELSINSKKASQKRVVPPFEWLPDDGDRAVDVRFMEDAPIRIGVGRFDGEPDQPGSTGPKKPINRFRNWLRDTHNPSLSISLSSLSDGSFSELNGFASALSLFETLPWNEGGTQVTTELTLGGDLISGTARWTITGNRHLNPASLSERLQESGSGLALWEWRPAFLSRSEQKGIRSSICSSQPYTVLARTTPGFEAEIKDKLASCEVEENEASAIDVVRCLGTRGIGLASLLTMGHSQSMEAIGFFMAFKALSKWESSASPGEVRCIVPMDSIYPLIDVLAVNSKELDGQRRADLLLVKARIDSVGGAKVWLHPLEIKARSSFRNRFPASTSNEMSDPVEQLKNTEDAIRALKTNLDRTGGALDLVNASVATLLEAGFAMTSVTNDQEASTEVAVLEAAANGALEVVATPGTLFWFQPGARGLGGLPFEARLGTLEAAGHLVSCFKIAAQSDGCDQYADQVSALVDSSMSEGGLAVTPPNGSLLSQGDEAKHQEPSGENPEPKSTEGTQKIPPSTIPPSVGREALEIEEASEIANQPNSSSDEKSIAEPVHDTSGIEVLVGAEHRAGQPRDVLLRPSDTALSQLNIGVVGDLGTGKTQFLKSLVYQLSQSALQNRGHQPKTFIFDYKQDYSSGEFPVSIGAKILDPTRTLPLNFFALDQSANQVDKVRRASFFADMLKRISSIGMVQRQNIYQSVMRAYEACPAGHWPMLGDVFDLYRDESGGKPDSVVSVLSLMTDLQIFERNPENVTSFNELYTGNTVLNLSTMGAGQDIVDILATMFLDHLYHDYMKRVAKAQFIIGADGVSRRQVDSFILIDEAHHAMGRGFEVLMKLMLEGREFGLGVILSSQFLSHFQTGGRDWAEALSTWVVHNVRNATSKDFDRIGFRGDTKALASEISALKTHWAYYRCAHGENEGVLIKGQPYFLLPRTS